MVARDLLLRRGSDAVIGIDTMLSDWRSVAFQRIVHVPCKKCSSHLTPKSCDPPRHALSGIKPSKCMMFLQSIEMSDEGLKEKPCGWIKTNSLNRIESFFTNNRHSWRDKQALTGAQISSGVLCSIISTDRHAEHGTVLRYSGRR